ncbi:MAG: GlxA family transcriptional regulator [Acidimicrobiales bacterium]
MLVYVLAIDGAAALNTLSVLDSLAKSNDAWRFMGDADAEDLFETQSAGPRGVARFHRGVSLEPSFRPSTAPTPGLVIIPGLADDVAASIRENEGWVDWIRRWHDEGAVVASSCTGAFLLAEAGILDGRRATTHWVAADFLAAAYPAVEVNAEALIIDEGSVITSAGATTAFNLILYIIGRFGGQERVNAATRLMLLDSGRASQQPFALTALHRDHADSVVHDAQTLVQNAVVDDLTVGGLAAAVGVSPRTLTRRFREALDITPQTYLEEVRVGAVRRLLEETQMPIDEVRTRVGFSDPTSFRRAFKRQTGLTPGDYRQRFSAVRR